MTNKSIENIERYTYLFDKYKSFLTQTQMQVFTLYFYEDLSYGEIAEITATTRSAAYDALSKALKKLDKIAVQMEEA
ncbi:sigma factor-like helix-turn-helix DNA-binding protein [Mycoplasma sp. Ms02]|uniref:sigma factor-like helix-turn-helix DNA-binding protein n=1 Tax=Mycoplasma sp. Ms02 TaxID=353851 RepID=UPI001C89E71F|nr:sigma factor-like helix-turn-helix DNA-binding protein [Mycoplasma sp. Ms02]QZE12250.1 hypothetical protein K4L35_02865 [Mycoplasma sp. Ms02]